MTRKCWQTHQVQAVANKHDNFWSHSLLDFIAFREFYLLYLELEISSERNLATLHLLFWSAELREKGWQERKGDWRQRADCWMRADWRERLLERTGFRREGVLEGKGFGGKGFQAMTAGKGWLHMGRQEGSRDRGKALAERKRGREQLREGRNADVESDQIGKSSTQLRTCCKNRLNGRKRGMSGVIRWRYENKIRVYALRVQTRSEMKRVVLVRGERVAIRCRGAPVNWLRSLRRSGDVNREIAWRASLQPWLISECRGNTNAGEQPNENRRQWRRWDLRKDHKNLLFSDLRLRKCSKIMSSERELNVCTLHPSETLISPARFIILLFLIRLHFRRNVGRSQQFHVPKASAKKTTRCPPPLRVRGVCQMFCLSQQMSSHLLRTISVHHRQRPRVKEVLKVVAIERCTAFKLTHVTSAAAQFTLPNTEYLPDQLPWSHTGHAPFALDVLIETPATHAQLGRWNSCVPCPKVSESRVGERGCRLSEFSADFTVKPVSWDLVLLPLYVQL